MTHAPLSLAEQHPIVYWLKLVSWLIEHNTDSVLGGAGVTRRHWQIMTFVDKRRSASYAAIDEYMAPFLAPHMPTVRPVVDDLCHRDWAIQVDKEHVRLTEVGGKAVADLEAQLAACRDRISAGISANEYDTAADVLRRMAVNLGWNEANDIGPV